MSKVQIEIPDDRWFRGEWDFRPQDKQLCVVIHKYGNQPPEIVQFREADRLHDEGAYFLCNGEKWGWEALGFEERWAPIISEYWGIDRWKPLGLPADVNERILAEIEKWFEEDGR